VNAVTLRRSSLVATIRPHIASATEYARLRHYHGRLGYPSDKYRAYAMRARALGGYRNKKQE
jgi:hypothetical protein